MKNKFLISLGLVLAAASAPAFAEGAGFVRGEIGNTDMKVGNVKDDASSYGVRGGYFFTPNIGLEGFYSRYGKVEGGGKVDGYGAGLVGKYNFGGAAHTGAYISGRAGMVRTKFSARLGGFGFSDDDTTAYVGIGGGYDFNRNFGIGLNYERQEPKFNGVRLKMETLMASAEYRF
jgi:OmpA-OmpF porin, OOP family